VVIGNNQNVQQQDPLYAAFHKLSKMAFKSASNENWATKVQRAVAPLSSWGEISEASASSSGNCFLFDSGIWSGIK
jgi:hypothetical protein